MALKLPRPGQLRWRAMVRKRDSARTTDAYGQKKPQHLDSFPCWVKKEALSGRELFEAQQVAPRATHMISMRYRKHVDETYQFEIDGETFEPVSVFSDDKRRWTITTCLKQS